MFLSIVCAFVLFCLFVCLFVFSTFTFGNILSHLVDIFFFASLFLSSFPGVKLEINNEEVCANSLGVHIIVSRAPSKLLFSLSLTPHSPDSY